MTKQELTRYEMLGRVRNFGETHRDEFPEASVGGQAFAVVAGAVTQLAQYNAARMSTGREGRATQAARQALSEKLDAIARTARVIAQATPATPAFDQPFRLSYPRTDEGLLTAGRVFMEHAQPVAVQFIVYGLADSFLADTQARIAEFQRAIRLREDSKSGRARVRTGIAEALSTGIAAARSLDVIVANQYEGDAVMLAGWERERHLDGIHRPHETADPVTEPVPAVHAPALTLASPAPSATPVAATPAPTAASIRDTERVSGVAS